MLYDAFRDDDLGALIRFRTDGNVFNPRRLNSKTIISKVLFRDLIFADDCALLAHTVGNIQAIANAFAKSASRFGLTISLKKTEVIYQPKPGADYTCPTITIDNKPLNVTGKFTYLGSTISQNALVDDEISALIGKSSGSFGKLTKCLERTRSAASYQQSMYTVPLCYQHCCMGVRHGHHNADTHGYSTSFTCVA